MKKRKCGSSGIPVSVLGVGTWAFGGTDDDYWGHQEDRDAEAVVMSALERGATFFDTAPVYNKGRSEEVLGRILKHRRNDAIIGTKVVPKKAEPAVLRQSCEESLTRLHTDYIDIYMIHWPIRDYSVDDAFATLSDLKAEGKIRSIGISNFGVNDIRETVGTGAPVDVNQVHYNLFSRAIEEEVTPLCMTHNIGIIAYMPLLQGILSGKFARLEDVPDNRLRTRHFRGNRSGTLHDGPGAEKEINIALSKIRKIAQEEGYTMSDLALSWSIHKPGIVSTIAGARTREQIEANCRAADLKLSHEIVSHLDAVTQPVLDGLGTNIDYWKTLENSRSR